MWAVLVRLFLLTDLSYVFAEQTVLGNQRVNQDGPGLGHFVFPHSIKRVAVIGAGPSGIQHAAALVEHGFEVRLFERKPRPGGAWSYSPKKPAYATFPYPILFL